ncbi:MAG TPA: TolC family protein [Gammaproteobacteria bacterium]|nr:TolC family protein [Gammaproteobacteria bacterium]
MSISFRFLIGNGIAAAIILLPLIAFADSAPLSMQESVTLALQRDSVLQQLAAGKQLVLAQATAAGQLPDPKLSAGIVNLPTNSYAVGQDSMTMQVIGISQEFPAGHTRSLAEQRGRQLADMQEAKIAERRRQVAQDVRVVWLNLYYASHALQLVRSSATAFQQLADIAKVRYENGSGTQQEWLRARLELATLREQELDLQAGMRIARAVLVRWLGEDAGTRRLPDSLPALPAPPPYAGILNALPSHPLAEADNAQITAAQTSVDIAEQAYQPAWGIDLSYGRRPGGDASGPFTNMVSAMVSVSLPIFTGKRQNQAVAAARAQANASIDSRDDQLRQLKRMLDEDWARWQQLQDLQTLYDQTVLPDAGADVTAGFDAYRNGGGDFFELVRSQVDELDARMRRLKIETDLDSVKATLIYLAGENS